MKRLKDMWSGLAFGPLVLVLWGCVMLGVILAGAITGFWLEKRQPPPALKERFVERTSRSAYETLTKEQADQCEADGGALVRGARPNQIYCFPARRTETAEPGSPSLHVTSDGQGGRGE